MGCTVVATPLHVECIVLYVLLTLLLNGKNSEEIRFVRALGHTDGGETP